MPPIARRPGGLASAEAFLKDCPLPAGDVRRFDEQDDPVNSGRFVVQGDQLFLTMGERGEELIAVPLRQAGRLTIETVDYTRR